MNSIKLQDIISGFFNLAVKVVATGYQNILSLLEWVFDTQLQH